MRYAIISDLHSNLQAWEAVYEDICDQEVDEIICLGDIVGYGPHPAEVFESCYETVHHMIMGNHDAAVCGKMHLDLFHTDPRRIIEWTQQALDPFALDFLSSLPLVLSGDQAFFTHACVHNPANFDYIYEAADCLPQWDACSERLIFSGHTHLPHVHMVGAMGQPQSLAAQDLRLSDDIRYFINVGSVGQPRDGDPRSSYVVYDSVERYVSFRRVAFDLEGYFASLKAKGLPVHPSMLGSQVGPVTDFNPLNMPRVMGRLDTTIEENEAKELNERFASLDDRRESETRDQVPAKPKKGKVFKASRTKVGATSRSRMGASPASSRIGASPASSRIGASPANRRRDATQRMRPKGRENVAATQKVPPKKSGAGALLLILGGIILLGVIVGIIMVLASR